jgi:hypothetical protein
MEDIDIIDLWKSYDKKLEETLALNRKNAEDITKMEVRSLVLSMRPIIVFTILAGLLWVGFVDVLLVTLFPVANLFFLVSAGIQVLLTKIAIGLYVYQFVLIHQVDISEPVLSTQEKLLRLRSSVLHVTRILFLQLPVWTTFYWNDSMLEHGNIFLYTLQVVVTVVCTFLAVWLFIHINYENRNKKWFKLMFKGKEWMPVIRSLELLSQIDEYKSEPDTGNIKLS